MAATLGKCGKCNKTVYGLEGFKVGPPRAEVAFHKICFKCTSFTRLLALLLAALNGGSVLRFVERLSISCIDLTNLFQSKERL